VLVDYFYRHLKTIIMDITFPIPEFENFPIEFKEINPEDFPNFIVKEDKKFIIEPNDEGFISEELIENIDLFHKDTTIINCGVGQGKTSAILETIKKYYDTKEYLIIVACPYKSLVEQYIEDIASKDIDINRIFNFKDIESFMESDNYPLNKISVEDFIIHVTTINCILNNPGEDYFISSSARRKYIDKLVSFCKLNNKKVVFIYDEIHDAIYNFKQEFIFYLWKWKDIIHKNYIVSATFSESSKIVIEYLAELTDKKIHIIESLRISKPDNLSELYLHYIDESSNGTNKVIEIIRKAIDKSMQLDILSYSKSFAETITKKNNEIYDLLSQHFGVKKLNLCVSNDYQGKSNKFKHNKLNIGTNFKSGVNITNENHCYIIIMPTNENRGIFTDGINPVVQAIARQRKKGEIHIILPYPAKFKYNSLTHMDENARTKFETIYEDLYDLSVSKLVSYISIKKQKELIMNFYNEFLLKSIENEILHIKYHISDRQYMPKLDYPDFKSYILESGDKFLASKEFFGGNLSSYITYAAITNQFVNCKLVKMDYKPRLNFKEGQVQTKLNDIFNIFIYEGNNEFLFLSSCDLESLKLFKDNLYSNFDISFSSIEGETKKLIRDKHKKFERQIINFIWKKKKQIQDLDDYEFTLSHFLRSNIAITNSITNGNTSFDYFRYDSTLLEAYSEIEYFRLKLIDNIKTANVGQESIKYLPNKAFEGFCDSEYEIQKFDRIIECLTKYDPFVYNDIFDFQLQFKKKRNVKAKIDSFYNLLRNSFFDKSDKTRKVFDENRIRKLVNPILEVLTIPNPDIVFNFIEIGNSRDFQDFGFYKESEVIASI
jgi:hypothetical protein